MIKKSFILFILSVVLLSFSSTSFSEEKKLTVEESVITAVSNNYDLASDKLGPEIAEKDIKIEEGAFNSVLFSDLTLFRGVDPSGSSLLGPRLRTDNFDGNVGIKKNYSLGGNFKLTFNNNYLDAPSTIQTLAPQYKSILNFSFTQPLLKNFGKEVATSRIVIARKSAEIAKNLYKEKLTSLIQQVINSYWDLVLAKKDLEAKKKSFERAIKLKEQNEIQVKVGTLAQIEVTQALATVASRKEGVIVAENTLNNAQDNLRRLLNANKNPVNYNPAIITVEEPVVKEINAKEDEVIKKSIENSYALNEAKLDLENKTLTVKVAKSQKLPQVDLIGNFALTGLSGKYHPSSTATSLVSPFAGNYNDNLDTMSKGDYYQWSAGIHFEYPLGNEAAVNTYKKRIFEMERAKLLLKSLEQKITLSAVQALRQVETDKKRIDTTQAAKKLTLEKLDAEEKKFKVGMSTTFNILTYQEDLINAETAEIKALIDYQKSLANLLMVQSLLMETYKIEVK